MTVKEIKWAGQKSSQDWGKRCYHDHPLLPITVEGQTYHVYGGSCGTPVWEECDVYVGLDHTMAEHEQRLPWVEGHAVHYRIQDGRVPLNPSEFAELIVWLSDQVLNNKKVHVGCIGGHGRTGLVLAALVAYITEVEDPITYVRTHYCKKAVESTMQVEFLMKHYGAKKVAPSKTHTWASQTHKKPPVRTGKVAPVDSPMRIWGDWIIEG